MTKLSTVDLPSTNQVSRVFLFCEQLMLVEDDATNQLLRNPAWMAKPARVAVSRRRSCAQSKTLRGGHSDSNAVYRTLSGTRATIQPILHAPPDMVSHALKLKSASVTWVGEHCAMRYACLCEHAMCSETRKNLIQQNQWQQQELLKTVHISSCMVTRFHEFMRKIEVKCSKTS